MNKNDSSMYHHAKMGRIQDLKKKLYALIAKGPAPAEDDVLDPKVHGLGQPVKRAADHAMPGGSRVSGMVEGSPDEEAMESPDEESLEGEDGELGEEDGMSELDKLRHSIFKPKQAPPKRPGTAMMIAVGKPQAAAAHSTYGKKMKAPFGKGKL